MSEPTDDERERVAQARKNLRRRAKAVEFEAFEDAELRREEEIKKLSAAAKSSGKTASRGVATGKPNLKAKSSQRGR
jgi:Ser-tRNA(Ala) deacylase AlaX